MPAMPDPALNTDAPRTALRACGESPLSFDSSGPTIAMTDLFRCAKAVAIVASALIDLIERSPNPAAAARDYLREMKSAGLRALAQ